jgi:hypothetical protein
MARDPKVSLTSLLSYVHDVLDDERSVAGFTFVLHDNSGSLYSSKLKPVVGAAVSHSQWINSF